MTLEGPDELITLQRAAAICGLSATTLVHQALSGILCTMRTERRRLTTRRWLHAYLLAASARTNGPGKPLPAGYAAPEDLATAPAVPPRATAARPDAAPAPLLDDVLRGYEPVQRRTLAQVGGDDGLTVPQYRCLQIMIRTGEALTTQLARTLGVRPPSITGVIDGLVMHGLVERQQHPQDRRQIRLVLTAAGRAHIERCQQAITDELQRLLTPLDPAQQVRLGAALADLRPVLDDGAVAPE
ncbi:MAG TPA: MarR family transcriptional regulator [Chloroflexota bacterium]|nr:MarR family transcriptional regulator [Chloroflexota bacterium]